MTEHSIQPLTQRCCYCGTPALEIVEGTAPVCTGIVATREILVIGSTGPIWIKKPVFAE